MANGNGAVPPTEHYRNLDDVAGQVPPTGPTDPVIVVLQEDAEAPPEDIGVEQADGSLIIHLSGKKPAEVDHAKAKEHDANLAEYIDPLELSRICDELLNGIDADLQSRLNWINERASGLKHLALKIENPRSPSADADTAVEGQAVIRSPILLDACMRFQANARGEMLPASGPVKVRNDTLPAVYPKTVPSADMSDADYEADVIETLMNRYLTVVDKEYYPDTNRMFLMQGFGGCGFKKVYQCPIKRRPVSRAIDANDIIVSDNEVSLHDCGRVTHRIEMRQSVMKRMQIAGTYRDIDLQPPIAPDPDAVELMEGEIAGLTLYSSRPQDYKHTVYECYCEFDIAGFEHKENGKITGLPLPYRISIDKDSQEILEVRRRWKEGDDRYIGTMPLVKYPFIEGLGFYGIGLLNIMGNATAAVTSAWRLALDSASFASWPGFLYSETVGRQDTMAFRVGLGSGVRINTGGQPIGNHVINLPYKDVTAGLVQVTQHIEEEARRVGGTPELMVGEGRQDVPVGTTLAMLDQAVKVIDSVHKGMHIAQAEELSLLRDLFIKDPGALVCDVADHQFHYPDIVRALKNCNLSPQADPNTPSHTIRVMKAVALIQLVQMNPQMWDLYAVVRRAAAMVGMGSVDELLKPPDQNQQQDPKVMKDMADIQLKMKQLAQDSQDMRMKYEIEKLSGMIDLMKAQSQLTNNREERASQERIKAAELANERMQLAEGALIHPLATPVAQQFAGQWPGFVPLPPPNRIL